MPTNENFNQPNNGGNPNPWFNQNNGGMNPNQGMNPNMNGTNPNPGVNPNNNGPRIIQTDAGAKDGQDKCPACGSTDITLNSKTGMLRCNFCRHEFKPQAFEGMETDIAHLEGEVFGSGTQNIQNDSDKNVVTLKCTSCGAEVVIDTAEVTQARCHWCRNTLSINQQVPNGAIPDMVLPFKLSKADAQKKIEEFVGKRKFFAHPKFVEEFTTNNIMGVYCPYMVVDVNGHARFTGQAEHELRHYTVGSGDNRRTRYDAELFDVQREFDLTIEGLTVESNSDKLDTKSANKTNNIINSIMPFDTENCVKWNANYLKGYTSEKRDVNVDQLRPLVDAQSADIARFAANETMQYYDRGARWSEQSFQVKGKQWRSAYLPIWLYSYQQKTNDGRDSILHYVAVNARTQETMGSVPIHMPKLLGVSAIIEAIGLILYLATIDFKYRWIFLLGGIIYYFIMYGKYRNKSARHHHETETKKHIFGLRKFDNFVKKLTGLSNAKINGMNSNQINGSNAKSSVINNLANDTINKFKDDPIDAIFGIQTKKKK